jgi:hypothetical protein
MNKRATELHLLAVALYVAGTALGQFSVTTFAQASVDATTTGHVQYDGIAASQSINQGAGATITSNNVSNVPQLLQATSQITASDTGDSGTASALATANLASGTLGVLSDGSQLGATASSAGALATMSDLLTFNVPGATSSTITNIGVSFTVNGAYTLLGNSQAYTGLTAYLSLGNGIIWWHFFTEDDPASQLIENSGWTSYQVPSETGNSFIFNGVLSVAGANPVANLYAELALQCSSANCDYTHAGAITLTLPAGVTYASASGVFLTLSGHACTDALSSDGQVFSSVGGSANVSVTAAAGCDWSISGAPSWITFPGSIGGTGNGNVSYQVQPNTGPDRSAILTIAGVAFTIKEAALVPGLSFIGSMPHIAAEENWTTILTVVNNTSSSNQVQFNLFGSNTDVSGSGSPLLLPVNLPQQPALGVILGASLDNTLSPFASWIVSTAGQGITPVQTGSAQVDATGALGGFAIFHRYSDAQEAVVPLTPGTPNPPSYLLAFDNTNGIVTSVAVANVSPQAANIGYIIRDDTGTQLGYGTLAPALPGNGQTSFVLPDPVNGFPVTVNKRGTIEFDTPAGGQISVLGVRDTPQVTTQGIVTTLTTVPPLANVGSSGGSFPFVASGGDGWQTTFVMVNTGSAAASATLSFFDTAGNPLSMPVSYPQTGSGTATLASFVTQLLAGGASLIVEIAGSSILLEGSAQLITSAKISGFAIFRYTPTGQEAVVPIESRNAPAYWLAFDNTSGIDTSISINDVTSGAQQVSIPVVIRDDSGNLLGQHNLHLAANGEFSGVLAQYSAALGAVLFPETANIRGTVEFDAPAGVQIGVLGVRTPPTHTYTTLPALVK